MTDDGWTNGKTLRYPSGLGSPDAEGLTRAELSSTAIYVATERDNTDGSVSRMSVLRYDYAWPTGTSLTATHEWNLTADLPAAGANAGLKPSPGSRTRTCWRPASSTRRRMPPTIRAGIRTTGRAVLRGPRGIGIDLRLRARSRRGNIHARRDGGQRKPRRDGAVFRSRRRQPVDVLRQHLRQPRVGAAHVQRPLHPQYLFNPPRRSPIRTTKGSRSRPRASACSGKKSFFWSDDSNSGGHAIYRGSIPCGRLP